MDTKMKTKWAVLAACAAISLAVAIGCNTEGGSTYGQGGGVLTNKPAIVEIRLGVPVCSPTPAPSALKESVFSGSAAGYLYIGPTCTDSNSSMYVWIKVLTSVSPSQVDSYTWTIKNWRSSSTTNGVFTPDSYDELLDTNGMFSVKTVANQIQYMSPANLPALAQLAKEQIDVTVMTRDGQIASGYIAFYLHNGHAGGDDTVFGTLTGQDLPYNASQARPGSVADYYTLVGKDTTNVIDMKGDLDTLGNFDTYLALYDSNLNTVAVNDDIGAGNKNSQIATFLNSGALYYVEATSFTNTLAGAYSLSVRDGILTNVPNPFPSNILCNNPASIAGDYSVTETMVISLTFNGQTHTFTNVTSTSATIMQDGCSFWYQFNDPAGVIPPVMRMGRVNYSTLSLYNETYIPQSPEISITSSTLSGSGQAFATGLQITSGGSIAGTFTDTFTPIPFRIDYTNSASFAK